MYRVLFEVLRISQEIKLTSLCFWRSLHSKGMMQNNEIKLYKQETESEPPMRNIEK